MIHFFLFSCYYLLFCPPQLHQLPPPSSVISPICSIFFCSVYLLSNIRVYCFSQASIGPPEEIHGGTRRVHLRLPLRVFFVCLSPLFCSQTTFISCFRVSAIPISGISFVILFPNWLVLLLKIVVFCRFIYVDLASLCARHIYVSRSSQTQQRRGSCNRRITAIKMSFPTTGSPEATRKASIQFQARGDVGPHGRVCSVRTPVLLQPTFASCLIDPPSLLGDTYHLDFDTDFFSFADFEIL